MRTTLGRRPNRSPMLGAGLALITDEFALLLDLRDVYWARQGRISIDIGVGGIAAAGSYFAALRADGRGSQTARATPWTAHSRPSASAAMRFLASNRSRGRRPAVRLGWEAM